MIIETIRKLLRLHIHSLRALLSIPELPLVLRQTRYDRFESSTLQWTYATLHIFWLPSGLGNISICPCVPRRLACSPPQTRCCNHPFWRVEQCYLCKTRCSSWEKRSANTRGNNAICGRRICPALASIYILGQQCCAKYIELLLVWQDDRCGSKEIPTAKRAEKKRKGYRNQDDWCGWEGQDRSWWDRGSQTNCSRGRGYLSDLINDIHLPLGESETRSQHGYDGEIWRLMVLWVREVNTAHRSITLILFVPQEHTLVSRSMKFITWTYWLPRNQILCVTPPSFCWEDFLKALLAADELRLWKQSPRKRGSQEPPSKKL